MKTCSPLIKELKFKEEVTAEEEVVDHSLHLWHKGVLMVEAVEEVLEERL